MKIAIIGGTGLLGSNLVKTFNNFDVRAFSRNSSKNIENSKNSIIDFTNLNNELIKYFDKWKPDVIVNSIALVNILKCEDDYSEALLSNFIIAKELAFIAKKYKSYFIHISTDHYYNDLNKKHKENQDILLLNNYAKTKYEAEVEVSKIYSDSLIVRTNIIGFRNNSIDSFFEWLVKSLKDQEAIKLYTNFYTSPISVNELGEILIKCYEKRLTGVYNIASNEVINKYDFGIKTANKFSFEIKNIEKSQLNNEKEELQRALTLGLDVGKIENALDIKMPKITETLNSLFEEYKKGTNEQ